MIAALVILQALDGATTLLALSLGFREVGPVMGPVMAHAGLAGMALLSIVLLGVELSMISSLRALVRRGLPRPVLGLGWAIALGIGIVPVASNALGILRAVA